MKQKILWQKRLAQALACSCLLFSGGIPAASAAAPAPQMHGSIMARAVADRGVAAYRAGHYQEALKYLTEADKQGQMKAARYIGLCYQHGYGVKKISRQQSSGTREASILATSPPCIISASSTKKVKA